jgi:hypothetical protein
MTPSGIDPTYFRFVAQCLNQLCQVQVVGFIHFYSTQNDKKLLSEIEYALFWGSICTDFPFYWNNNHQHETVQTIPLLNPYQPPINYHISI